MAAAPRAVPARAPRPDDPIPRRPPAFFIRDLKRTGSRDLKRTASSSKLPPIKRQKTVGALGELGSEVRLGAGVEEGMFKVPEVPKQAKGKGKERERDVFGEVVGAAAAKGKQKAEDAGDAGLEKANRNVRTCVCAVPRALTHLSF